jgi:hypothetical protein
MGVVNTYSERNGVDFPFSRVVATSFRSSSSSFSRGATYTVQTNSTQNQSTSTSSSSGSASAGTWYTRASSDEYTSSTSSGADGEANGSSTVSTLTVNNSEFSSQISTLSFQRASTIGTTISNLANFASFSDLKPTVVSLSKSLFLKEPPYWWSVGKTETTTTTNQYTTTKNTSETTFTRKTQDTGGATSEYTFEIVSSVAGSPITKNKLPNIVVAATADVYSYQIFSAKSANNVEFSEAYKSLEGPVATVTINYNVTNDDVKVFTLTGPDDELPSTSSYKNEFDYGDASSTISGSPTAVVATVSYYWNDAASYNTDAEEWVIVPGYWQTGAQYNIGQIGTFQHRGTTTRPGTISAAANSTVLGFSYLEDISATENTETGFTVFATSYTYKQNGKTKTRYFAPIATTVAGTIPNLYTTTVVSTVRLETREVVSSSTSNSGEQISPGFTATYSSSRISVQGITAKDYWHDFSVMTPVNIFYAGGYNQLPAVAFYKHFPEGFLGFIGSYSDIKTLTAYRNIKVNTSGQPFGSASLDIYDLTELFFEARKGGTVFYPKFYATFREFTVIGTGVDGSLQTSAELSVIYSRTTTTSQTRATTTNSFYNSTGITKSRNNTNVNVGTTTKVKTYKKRTTTNTTRNTVELTTVTYKYELEDPVSTTGFAQYNVNELDFAQHIKGVNVPVGLNRAYFSRGIIGCMNGLGDTTVQFRNCSLLYTMYDSTGGSSSSKTVYSNISEQHEFTISKSHIMHAALKGLYNTYKQYGSTPNIPAFNFFGLTTSTQGFTF